jgi:ribosomal protein S12 methylthiotransferase accessory factor
VLYPEDQYDHLPYRPYTDSSTLGWVEARSLTSGHTTQVPAIAVYLGYECHAPEEFLFPATSSGLAAGPTLAQAILAAACEVIERDAFLAMWLLRLPCVRVDPLTHPDPAVVDLCLSYRRRGVTLELYRIPMDHRCAVFAAVGVEPEGKDGPAAVVGLGAGLDPARAARSAVFEVGQVRPALRGRLRDPATKRRLHELLEEPSRVATLEDHDLLYASPAMLRSFDFLRRSPLEEQSWTGPGGGASTHLEALVNDLEERGTEVLYCNLTTEDVGQRGLHVARVLIPDFQPIYFGEAERRLGGDRLFELPRLLGLQPTPAALSDLNADPHPLA